MGTLLEGYPLIIVITIGPIYFLITALWFSRLYVVPYIILLIGSILNWLVIAANGGYMPVLGLAEPHDAWITMTETTRMNLLGDRLLGSLSIGDIFLFVGIVGIVSRMVGIVARVAWTIRWRDN